MSDYAIGDIQGCYAPLLHLLDKIQFNEREDRLWLVGDLVNRGPQSLEVLRFIKNLPISPRITLGNHDLHLLSRIYLNSSANRDDTLQTILKAEDKEELGDWLRSQSLLFHDQNLNIVLTHAGIAPIWSLDQAKASAKEVESALTSDLFLDFLKHMYGNQPDLWSPDLKGFERLRIITNYFTRMRFCNAEGRLIMHYKGTVEEAEQNLIPWYLVPHRKTIPADIVFGHWAALKGRCPVQGIYALDTGCYWGGELTALRLQDRTRFSVKGLGAVDRP